MVRIQQKSNGQYVVTIDRSLAEGMNLTGGEDAEWSIKSRNALRLDIIERNPDVDDD